MDTVAPEVLLEILRFLDQDDLRRAAAVSHVFYDSAWLAGLIIPRTFHWHNNTNYDEELATLNVIVHHALLKGLRLGLTFAAFDTEDIFDGETVDASPTPSDAFFPLIHTALPVLHTLSLFVPAPLFPSLSNALRFPAPILQDLELGVTETHTMPLPDVPANILGGIAPKLRLVELRNVRLAGDAISAFSQASSVHVDYDQRNTDVDLALHFPRVRNLRLALFSSPDAHAPVPYKLDGLGLRRLTFYEHNPPALIPAILRCNTLEKIPDILYCCCSLQCGERLWQKSDDGPFNIRLTMAGDIEHRRPGALVVVPDHRLWRRAFILADCRVPWQCPINAIPQVSARLICLRMRNCFVIGLLECAGLDLIALRTLRIDFDAENPLSAMLWPPDWSDKLGTGTFLSGPLDISTPTFARESYSYISCGALQTLVLFDVSGTVNINSQEVAFFGRALSQCTRLKQDRAALELVGVKLNCKQPIAHDLLDQTFSTIRSDGLEGLDALAGRDDAFWERLE